MHTNIKPISVLALSAIFSIPAQSDIITMVHQGSGSGSIGQQVFENADFTITGTADTDNRMGSGISGFYLYHSNATVHIAGIGSFDILTDTLTFVNNNAEFGGFGNTDFLFNAIRYSTNPAFANWDMTTSIEPITTAANIFSWYSYPLSTSGGYLELTNSSTIATFTSTVIPTPAALSLLTITGLAATRRRRRA